MSRFERQLISDKMLSKADYGHWRETGKLWSGQHHQSIVNSTGTEPNVRRRSDLQKGPRDGLLTVLFDHVGESYYLRQLARVTGVALGPVQWELRQLVDAGLVTKRILGTQTLYGVNGASLVFPRDESQGQHYGPYGQ